MSKIYHSDGEQTIQHKVILPGWMEFFLNFINCKILVEQALFLSFARRMLPGDYETYTESMDFVSLMNELLFVDHRPCIMLFDAFVAPVAMGRLGRQLLFDSMTVTFIMMTYIDASQHWQL